MCLTFLYIFFIFLCCFQRSRLDEPLRLFLIASRATTRSRTAYRGAPSVLFIQAAAYMQSLWERYRGATPPPNLFSKNFIHGFCVWLYTFVRGVTVVGSCVFRSLYSPRRYLTVCARDGDAAMASYISMWPTAVRTCRCFLCCCCCCCCWPNLQSYRVVVIIFGR